MNIEEIEKTEAESHEGAETVNIDEVNIDETGKNLAEMDKAEEQEQAVSLEEDLNEQIRNNILRNVTLADAEIKMFGDRTVLAQIAQLVAYIRHAIKNDTPTEIKLSICKSDSTVAGAEFMFDLNGCQVPDLVPQPEVFIN